MIREEAVTVLKAFMENPLFSEVHKAAFNIAIHDIKAYQDWNINNLILVNKDDYEPLEQEPTSKNSLEVDCISKQEVIELMMQKWGENFSGDDAMQESIDAIREMPSVTPQEPRWIPVTEKLPHDRDWYLGIFKEPDTGWINPLPYICDYVGRETKATTKGHWILRGFTDWDDYHIDYYFNLECVAWMLLPKAYKEVEE